MFAYDRVLVICYDERIHCHAGATYEVTLELHKRRFRSICEIKCTYHLCVIAVYKIDNSFSSKKKKKGDPQENKKKIKIKRKYPECQVFHGYSIDGASMLYRHKRSQEVLRHLVILAVSSRESAFTRALKALSKITLSRPCLRKNRKQLVR